MRLNAPVEVLKAPWIRPEDVDLYLSSGVSFLKIGGRGLSGADFPRMVRAYRQRWIEGDLVEFFQGYSPNAFWKLFSLPDTSVRDVLPQILARPMGCNGDECPDCLLCEEWARENEILIRGKASEDAAEEFGNYVRTGRACDLSQGGAQSFHLDGAEMQDGRDRDE